jgi:hypothetical protein
MDFLGSHQAYVIGISGSLNPPQKPGAEEGSMIRAGWVFVNQKPLCAQGNPPVAGGIKNKRGRETPCPGKGQDSLKQEGGKKYEKVVILPFIHNPGVDGMPEDRCGQGGG